MASEDGSAAAAASTASPGKMPHSHSSPATVDAISLNETSDTKHRSGKLLSVDITLLDDTDVTMNVQEDSNGAGRCMNTENRSHFLH